MLKPRVELPDPVRNYLTYYLEKQFTGVRGID